MSLLPQISSAESITSYCSTLFAEFDLKTDAIYNFYKQDETTEVEQVTLNNTFARYIKIKWNTIKQVDVELTEKQFKTILKTSKKDFTVEFANNSTVNGFISPGVINCLVTDAAFAKFDEFDENAFLNSDFENNSYFINNKKFFKVAKNDDKINYTRVDFIDPSITGLLDDNRITASQKDIHIMTIGAIAKISKNLEIISELNQDTEIQNKIPSFDVMNKQQKNLSYVGYILEKFIIDQNGSFSFVERFFIDDLSIGEIIDSKVLYGKKYAYRIKCIAQWTRNRSIDFSYSSIDRNFSIDENNPNLLLVSFYSCEWSDWSTAIIYDNVIPKCPDEFNVMPVNNHNIISWKMPYDPQLDIKKIRLLKSIVTHNKCTDWIQIYECDARNGIYIDKDVSFFEDSNQKYMYSMYTTSEHDEFSNITDRIIVKLSKRHSNSSVNSLQSVDIQPSVTAFIDVENDTNDIHFEEKIKFTIKNDIYKNRFNKKEYILYIKSLKTAEVIKQKITIRAIDV